MSTDPSDASSRNLLQTQNQFQSGNDKYSDEAGCQTKEDVNLGDLKVIFRPLTSYTYIGFCLKTAISSHVPTVVGWMISPLGARR